MSNNPNEWDEATKIEALTIWRTDGASQAARVTGVPSGTIRRWVHESGLGGPRRDELAAQKQADAEARVAAEEEHQRRLREWLTARQENIALKRAELQEMLWDRAVEILHRMDDAQFKAVTISGDVVFDKPSGMDLRNMAIAVGVLIDKGRLEGGEVTNRTETITLGDVESAIRSLEAEMERTGAGGT